MNTHPIRRSAVGALLMCVGLLALAPAASAGEKVTIRHATGSATNPYVQITISVNAVKAHRAHHNGEDIIPATVGCVPPPPLPIDVCPNLAGDQPTIPAGMFVDASGNCVPIVVEPPVDVCPNILGDQPTVPEGFVKDALGDGVPIIVEPPLIPCI